MIPKMSSQELNNLMLQSKDDIKTISDKVDTIKIELDKKLEIIKYENEYTNTKLQEIKNNIVQLVPGFKAFAKGDTGSYEVYGYSVHPVFIRRPINVFNLQLSNGNLFFRNDVNVYVNGQEDSSYNDILKHDSIADKNIFFTEFTSDTVEIKIEADKTNPLGPTLFNVIEIDSFLPGSYDITDILFSYYDENGVLNSDKSLKTMLYSYRNSAEQEILISQAGKCRLILPKKVSLKSIIMKVKIKYSFDNAGVKVYPFGLKHVYFYNADFNMSSSPQLVGMAYGSYMITTITSNEYINMLDDAITLRTTIGNINSTITAENIELYLDNIDGALDTPVYPNEEIPRNTNTIYAKIPFTKQESSVGIVFNIYNR